MRNLLTIAALAVSLLILLLGIRWLGLISHDAMVIGFVTGAVVGVMMLPANRRKGGTG